MSVISKADGVISSASQRSSYWFYLRSFVTLEIFILSRPETKRLISVIIVLKSSVILVAS